MPVKKKFKYKVGMEREKGKTLPPKKNIKKTHPDPNSPHKSCGAAAAAATARATTAKDRSHHSQ